MQSTRAAARGKHRKAEVARYLLDMEQNSFMLADALAHGEWRPGAYTTFYVHEPKKRLISAAPFRDRVVHHALVSLLEPHFERRFVAHSYACRKGKGTHKALHRASRLMATRRFVLKGDVKTFFPTIDHELLKLELRRAIADERLLRVMDLVIDSSNPQESETEWFAGDGLFAPVERRRGIPIGNLTSQFLANVFLDPFDHFVMDRLRRGDYIRYCDDFLIFGEDRDELWGVREEVRAALARQRLLLHPRKGGVHVTHSQVPFLGFVLCRGRRRLQRASLVRATRRLRSLSREVEAGADSDGLRASLAAWYGHVRHATDAVPLVECVRGRIATGLVPKMVRTV